MKFILCAFALATAATAQYTVGTVGNVNLPTTGTQGSTGSVNVAVQNIPDRSFPASNPLVLIEGSSSSTVTNNNIRSAIESVRSQLSTPLDSFSDLFDRLPSLDNIAKMAEDADSAAFARTLGMIEGKAGDNSCNPKLQYLQNIISTINGSLSNKNRKLGEADTIIKGAVAEVARLQREIAIKQQDRDNLGLPAIEARIADLVPKINSLYDQISVLRNQIPIEEAKIVGYQNEITNYNRQNEMERNKISNDKLKLNQIVSLIADLESRLKDATDKKVYLETSIAQSEAIIKDNDAKIVGLRNTISDIQAKIRNLKSTFDKIRRDSNAVEVDLERARSDLSVAQTKDQKFVSDLADLNAKIDQLLPNTSDVNVNEIQNQVNRLKTSVPILQNGIDREYYYCKGKGSVTVEITGNTAIYVVKGDAFGSYLKSAYGESSNFQAPNVNASGSYFLKSVDPFSADWAAMCGFNLKPTMSCSGSTVTGGSMVDSGVITGFNDQGIEVKNAKGEKINLTISPCSRIEAVQGTLGINSQAYWSAGPSSSNGGFAVYSVERLTAI